MLYHSRCINICGRTEGGLLGKVESFHGFPTKIDSVSERALRQQPIRTTTEPPCAVAVSGSSKSSQMMMI